MRQKFVKNLARQRRAVRFIQHIFRTFLAAIVSFSTIAFSLVFMPISATAAVPVLNDNTDVFQISFTGATASDLINQTLLMPNKLQAQWSLNPTYNSTTKNYDVGTDWITISPVTTVANQTVKVPTSGSGPNGTVAQLSPTASDIVVLTIRADPQNVGSASLGGYLGSQSAAAGIKAATDIANHSTTSANSKAYELLSFGSFSGFQVLQDAFSQTPPTFTISAKLPSSVTDLSYAFFGNNNVNPATYNKTDITAWDTSNVTNMSNMFNANRSFNQNISGWNTSRVTDMSRMFSDNIVFNQPIGSWDTSNVRDMKYMFYNANAFNFPLDSWSTGNVTNMSGMFKVAKLFNQNLNSWDVSKVTDMSYMFDSAFVFNGNVSSWVTSNVTSMKNMFYLARAFNQSVSNWNVSKVTNFSYMFSGAWAFNQNLNSWVPSSATNFEALFQNAYSFNNGTANSMTWVNLTKVTTMFNMFQNATAFNQNLNTWVMDRNPTYKNMFLGATSFNNGLASGVSGSMTWNLVGNGIPATSSSPATDMTSMFQGATAFNQNLNSWDVSFVALMPNMFYGATAFNNGKAPGVSGNMTWKMANGVTDINAMFQNASSFNQSLSTWVTTSVTKFYNLLTGANSFNQSLASFNVYGWQNQSTIAFPASVSDQNLQDTLKSWAWQAHPGAINVSVASTHNLYSDCASYNAYLILNAAITINSGLKPTPPNCSNAGTLSWVSNTANTSPAVVNGINNSDSNIFTFTPSALPTGKLLLVCNAICSVPGRPGNWCSCLSRWSHNL